MSWRIAVRANVGTLAVRVDVAGDLDPLALVGPNGSGKTTLLRIFAGAHTPASGIIEVDQRVLFDSRRSINLAPEHRLLGYVPQGYGLFPHLRVIDNVAFGLSTVRHRRPSAERHAVARDMLRELGCADLAQRLPRRLSGGEQQRVALARALVMNPAMLLLDEPVSALDAGSRRRVRTFLAERLRAIGRPSLVVTHDVRDVAALGATVCVLDRGQVVQTGTLDELRSAPANDFVAEFVGVDPKSFGD